LTTWLVYKKRAAEKNQERLLKPFFSAENNHLKQRRSTAELRKNQCFLNPNPNSKTISALWEAVSANKKD
jgi:hypothetical protein